MSPLHFSLQTDLKKKVLLCVGRLKEDQGGAWRRWGEEWPQGDWEGIGSNARQKGNVALQEREKRITWGLPGKKEFHVASAPAFSVHRALCFDVSLKHRRVHRSPCISLIFTN